MAETSHIDLKAFVEVRCDLFLKCVGPLQVSLASCARIRSLDVSLTLVSQNLWLIGLSQYPHILPSSHSRQFRYISGHFVKFLVLSVDTGF